MDYLALQTFADTWGLMYMTLLFIGIVAWVMRPGGKQRYDRVSKLPLEED